jgi:hypothetical protein
MSLNTTMSEPQHNERKHAAISPSALKHFDDCPGYVREERDDDEPIHPVTAEGTLIHEALDNDDFSGLTKDQQELAGFCIDYAGMLPTSVGEIIKEPKLDIAAGVFGYVDQVQIDEDVADVLDWKMGWIRVEPASENLQGLAYSLGVFKKWQHIREVTVHFVQPRLGYVTAHTFTRDEMPAMEMRVRGIVARVSNVDLDDPDSFTPCEHTCIYCARHNCPAVAKAANTIGIRYAEAKNDHAKTLAALENKKPTGLLDVPEQLYPKLLDKPEEMAKAMELLPIVERWCKSLRKRSNDMAFGEGIAIPGYETAHRAGRKNVTNANAAYEAVKDRVPLGDFLTEQSYGLRRSLRRRGRSLPAENKKQVNQ